MQTIYFYDTDTGEFAGESVARESPREPGVYLIPAGATEVQPPAAQKGFARVFRNGWQQLEDHRGEIWYRADGARIVIHELGPVDAELVTQTVPPQFGAWDGSAWVVDTVAQDAALLDEQEADRLESETAALKGNAAIKALINATPAEIDTWLQNNVTDLASARNAMAIQLKVLAVLARRSVG